MKKDYMTQLSNWARWMIPWQEAEDVIADYHDIVGTPPRSGEDLIRDLGKPRDVAKALTQPKKYHIWLTTFTFMTVCILTLVIDPLFVPLVFKAVMRLRIDIFFCYFLSVAGTITALVWFHRQGRKTDCFPKAVLILLAVLLVLAGGVVLFYWIALGDPNAILRIRDEILAAWFPYGPFDLAAFIICYSCPLIVLIGVYGLIKARTRDCRWAAVYVLAMAAVLIFRMILEWVTTMDMDFAIYDVAYRQLMLRCAVVAAAGLIGTGVALC